MGWATLHPVNGGCGTWSSWTKCNAKCPKTRGKQMRTRKCGNPKPENGGETCVGEEKEELTDKTICIRLAHLKAEKPIEGRSGK